jgi:hypothetical protein
VVPADLATQAWYRLDPIIDTGGALRGQRVSLGRGGVRAIRTVELPPEAFAAGPFGRIVLIGSDDGAASRLQAVDVVTGCAWTVAVESDVVRRATIDPAGGLVYEARVDRASRADLGIWSMPLDGVAPASSVLPPLGPDARFGRTFSTEFAWAVDGSDLAVQSCGEAACRIRTVGLAGRPSRELAQSDLGLLAGFDGERVVTYAACRGLPCPVVATNLATGARQGLVAESGLALVLPTSAGPRLIHERFEPAGLRLRSIALDGTAEADLGQLPDGLRLQATPDRAGGATRLPFDWVLVAPDGRQPIDATSPGSQLRHLPDGLAVALSEVVR